MSRYTYLTRYGVRIKPVMPTRRQQKVARLVKEAVSDAIANHLSDPRIEGFVSVTRVEMAPDLRSSDVYLSILGKDDASQNKTFAAITHAKKHIQGILAAKLQSKFCPLLRLHRDEKFKKTLEIMNLIDKVVGQSQNKDSIDHKDD